MIQPQFLIIDDHPLMQLAIKQILEAEFFRASVHLASSFSEALSVLESEPIDMVLIDLFLSSTDRADPFHNVRRLLNCKKTARVCVISAAEYPEYVQQSLEYGLCGFIPKSIDPLHLVAAIRVMLTGGCYFPQSLIALLQTQGSTRGPTLPPHITSRQSEILDFLLAGHPNKSIARDLGISLQTVKAHLTCIMATLQVENRTQLALAVNKYDQHNPSWRDRPTGISDKQKLG